MVLADKMGVLIQAEKPESLKGFVRPSRIDKRFYEMVKDEKDNTRKGKINSRW
ncbi:MAG: hypothetical protein ACYDEF_03705 [Methanosarcina sp.]